MKKLLVIMTLALVLVFAGCEKKEEGAKEADKAEAGDATVYATVNGEEVTKDQYDRIYDMYLKTMAVQYRIAEKAKDALVHETVLMQEIAKNKIEVTEEKINADYDAAVASSGSKEDHMKLLAEYGITEEEDRKNMRLSSYFNAHREWFEKSFPVSDENIKTYYEENKDNLDTVIASHILVDSLEAATAVKNRLDKGEDFEALAKELSQDPASKENGGSLGESPATGYVPEFAEAVKTQEIGVISNPVQTQFGYHIIRVDERKTGLEAHIDTIKQRMHAEAYDKYMQALFEDAKVELK